jgi:hypothetical protein
MKRKAYVRVTETFDHLAEPVEVCVGVELSKVLTVKAQYVRLREYIRSAMSPWLLRNWSDEAIAGAIEAVIKDRYPEHISYFIEVGRGKMDEYVQVFEVGE